MKRSVVLHLLNLVTTSLARHDGTAELDLARIPRALHDLQSRSAPIIAPLTFTDQYIINLTIGTPPQNISLAIDTGSSNIWFPSTDSEACRSSSKCADGVAFNPKDSTSLVFLSNGSFSATYGTAATTGDYIQDTVRVISVALGNLTMGLAVNGSGTLTNGLLGLGYDSLESLASETGTQFPGFLTRLQQSGAIARRLFSVYLDDQEAGTGTILFGGIDTSKYVGDLVSLAITPNGTGAYDRYRVDLTAVSFVDHIGNTTLLSLANMSAPAVLDTGANINILPIPVTRALVQGTGAVYDGGYYWADCTLRNSNASINFQFGGIDGPSIDVPISQILGVPTGVTFNDSSDACQLFVEHVSDIDSSFVELGGYTLGQPFIRCAYVVYDQDNNELSLAQAIFNQTKREDIQSIAAGSHLPMVSSTETATASSAPTTLPPATSSQVVTSLQNSQSSAPDVTGTTQISDLPSSPSFDIAPATGGSSAGGVVATYTSTSGTIHRHSTDICKVGVLLVLALIFSAIPSIGL